MTEYMECNSCHGRFKPPSYPLNPGEASMTWGIVFRDEAYRDDGSVYVPKGKRLRDILVGFKCPRCGYVEKAEPERDHGWEKTT